MIATIEPSWIITVSTPPGSSNPSSDRRSAGARSRTPAETPSRGGRPGGRRDDVRQVSGSSGLALRLRPALRAAERSSWTRARATRASRCPAPEAHDCRGDEHAGIGAVMMPTTMVNANPWSTSPPKKNSASAVSGGARCDDRPAERLVHRRVDDVGHRVPAHRSQILTNRSKITIVSLVEWPVIVKMAAMTFRSGRTGRTRGTRT